MFLFWFTSSLFSLFPSQRLLYHCLILCLICCLLFKVSILVLKCSLCWYVAVCSLAPNPLLLDRPPLHHCPPSFLRSSHPHPHLHQPSHPPTSTHPFCPFPYSTNRGLGSFFALSVQPGLQGGRAKKGTGNAMVALTVENVHGRSGGQMDLDGEGKSSNIRLLPLLPLLSLLFASWKESHLGSPEKEKAKFHSCWMWSVCSTFSSFLRLLGTRKRFTGKHK